MRFKVTLIALATAAGLVASACSGSNGSTTTTPSGDNGTSGSTEASGESGDASTSFIVGSGDIDSLDPVRFRSLAAYTVTANIYASLLEPELAEKAGFLQPTGKTTPGLAKSLEMSDDGTVATFTLRDGLTFADGSPITAEDVAYSLQRALSDAGYTSALAPYMGIKDGSAITAPDDKTVKITLEHPSALFKRFIAFQVFGVVSKAVAEKHNGDDQWATQYFNSNATPSGPYKISAWDKGQQVVLEKNENYWDASNVKATKITLKNMPDANQQYLALKNGAIDIAIGSQGLPPNLVAKAKDDPDLTVYDMPTSFIYYLGMNNDDPVLKNRLVRQAISYAVPYQALRNQVMHGFARSAYGPVPAGMETALDDTGTKDAYPTDPDKAKELLQQAGVDDLKLTLSVQASDSNAVESATFIQGSLQEIGVDVAIDKLTDADFIEKLNSKQLQFFIDSWYSWGEDPFYQMNFLLHSDQPTNRANYSNPEVDSDIDKGVVTADESERVKLSQDAQRQVIEDAPWAFLFTTDVLVVARKGISGVSRASDNYLRFQYLTRN